MIRKIGQISTNNVITNSLIKNTSLEDYLKVEIRDFQDTFNAQEGDTDSAEFSYAVFTLDDKHIYEVDQDKLQQMMYLKHIGDEELGRDVMDTYIEFVQIKTRMKVTGFGHFTFSTRLELDKKKASQELQDEIHEYISSGKATEDYKAQCESLDITPSSSNYGEFLSDKYPEAGFESAKVIHGTLEKEKELTTISYEGIENDEGYIIFPPTPDTETHGEGEKEFTEYIEDNKRLLFTNLCL